MQAKAYVSTVIPTAAKLQNKNLWNSGSTREALINHVISVRISANEIYRPSLLVEMRERCRWLSLHICFTPGVLMWLMATPHRCFYEDHQSRSRADRKCQNNAAILAVFLMRPGRTYTRESCIRKIWWRSVTPFEHVFIDEGKARLGKLPTSSGWQPPFTLMPTLALMPSSLSFLPLRFLPGEGSHGGCTAEGHALLIAPWMKPSIMLQPIYDTHLSLYFYLCGDS